MCDGNNISNKHWHEVLSKNYKALESFEKHERQNENRRKAEKEKNEKRAQEIRKKNIKKQAHNPSRENVQGVLIKPALLT